MAVEDFGNFTEVDPNSRITKTTRRVTWADWNRNDDALVYKDFGVDYFNGNFVFLCTLRLTVLDSGFFGAILTLANTIDILQDMDIASAPFLTIRLSLKFGTHIDLAVWEQGESIDEILLLWTTYANTDLYLSFQRDESVGANGTLYCYIFSDAARSTLINSASIALAAKTDFRYLYALQSWHPDELDFTTDGYVENLDLEAAILPVVTAQPLTDIVSTTATGHGTIVDLGISAVSAHGYVWDSTVDPTTVDSSSGFWGSTDSGAGSLGVFESSITGLLAGQEYYFRPYATNGAGTAYGANVYAIAGQPSTLRIKAEYAVVQTKWHYVDEDGKEREIEGILV